MANDRAWYKDGGTGRGKRNDGVRSGEMGKEKGEGRGREKEGVGANGEKCEGVRERI